MSVNEALYGGAIEGPVSLAAPPLHKRRKGLVRRRYPSCSAGMQLTSRVVTIFYAPPRSAAIPRS